MHRHDLAIRSRIVRPAISRMTEPDSAHAAVRLEHGHDLRMIEHGRSLALRGEHERNHQPLRTLDQAVVPQRGARRLLYRQWAREGPVLRSAYRARSRKIHGACRTGADGEQVVRSKCKRERCTRTATHSGRRQNARERLHESRGEGTKRGPLTYRGTKPRNVHRLEVAKATMCNLEGVRARTTPEVVPL